MLSTPGYVFFLNNKSIRKGMSGIAAMDGYEKIKTVGKGSFGTATLYRRTTDNILVVMKEVYIIDMSQAERKLAMNEVEVLSALDHDNIIRYLGSFVKDGSLVIIMEYANGGNLAQLISSKKERTETFAETAILQIFSQICDGIGYMHSNKILHRDLKSANIFINKNGTIKIGDFGISKMMDTRSQAQTVVGTPYYLSPEMCEGLDYNEKSDIWSMGCILYELAALRKPFEAQSLPALVHKILACDFSPIPDVYSPGMSQLVELILQRNPDNRPSALYIFETIIPALHKELESEDIGRRVSMISFFNKSIPRERSVLYELYGFTSQANLYPVELPHSKIIDFSNSASHFMIVTGDKKVYTWGDDTHGQLAHGQIGSHKKYPSSVDSLRGKNIVRVFAGDGYSLFLNMNGTMLSCGDGRNGCLGHGDWANVVRPKIIESLTKLSITDISCGARHVLALASNGRVHVWGSADNGQLGLGHTQLCCKPVPVQISNDYNIKKIFAGSNCSAMITTAGKVLVSGSNQFNKLGFENVAYLKTFVILTDINEKIETLSFGETHTVLLTENGEVICVGNNDDRQCTNGKSINGFVKVQGLKSVVYISAGPSYTVAGTDDNIIYFWGTHFENVDDLGMSASAMSGSGNSRVLLVKENLQFSNTNNNYASACFGTKCSHQFVTPHYIVESSFKSKYSVNEDTNLGFPIIEPVPKPILALYASPKNIKANNIIWLAGLTANDNSVSVIVHTTAPPPIKASLPEEDIDNQSKVVDSNWPGPQRSAGEISLPNTPEIT